MMRQVLNGHTERIRMRLDLKPAVGILEHRQPSNEPGWLQTDVA